MRASKAYQLPTTTSRENAPQKSKIECEFELFMSHPHVKNEKSINPLEWWGKKSEIFSILSGVAKKWFCIPTSSATSERVFSAGGNIVTYKRTRLQPENVDKLAYIQQNFSKVKIRNWKLSFNALDENKKDVVIKTNRILQLSTILLIMRQSLIFPKAFESNLVIHSFLEQ